MSNQTTSIEQGLVKLSSLIGDYMKTGPTDECPPPHVFSVHSRDVSFNAKQADTFQDILDCLVPDRGSPSPVSRRAAESMVRHCIAAVVHSQADEKISASKARIRNALDKLRVGLKTQPKRWEVWQKVDHLSVPQTGFCFGPVLFCYANHPDAAGNSASALFGRDVRADVVLCRIPLDAVDADAAMDRGEALLQECLDIINFFSAVMSPSHPTPVVAVNGSWQPYKTTMFVRVQGEHSGTIKRGSHRQCDDFNPNILSCRRPLALGGSDPEAAISRAFQKAGELLGKGHCTKSDERILSALKLAGKAAVAERQETSFLFWWIALEGLLLGTRRPAKVSETLRKRIGRVLKPNHQD